MSHTIGGRSLRQKSRRDSYCEEKHAEARRGSLSAEDFRNAAATKSKFIPIRTEVSACMMSRRVLSCFCLPGPCRTPAGTDCGFPAQAASPQPSSDSHTIAIAVPDGTPLQIALHKEVHVRKIGEPISGRVVQPVYVFDRLVIPVGTVATGQISSISPVPGRTRTLDALNADFTPPISSRRFQRTRSADGRHIDLHATVVPGSGQVIRLVTADEHKKNVVKDAVAQKMAQARAQWNDAMKQVKSPGRMHLVVALCRRPASSASAIPRCRERYTQQKYRSHSTLAVNPYPPDTLSGIGTRASAWKPCPCRPADSAELGDHQPRAPKWKPNSRNRSSTKHASSFPPELASAAPFSRCGPPAVCIATDSCASSSVRSSFPMGSVQTVDTRLQGIQSDSADNAQLDSEGGAKSTASKTRYLSTGASVGLALIGSGGRKDVGDASPTAGGATGFKLIGLIVGIAFRSHTYGILMSAYGGSRSIYNNFLGKGRDIVFPKDTLMEIGFGNRTSLPMPSTAPGESR